MAFCCLSRLLWRLLPLLLLLSPGQTRLGRRDGTAALQQLQLGLDHHDEGRTAEALAAYDVVLAETRPEVSAGILAPRAAALEELGRWPEAAAAVQVVPEGARWQLELARALSWERAGGGRREEAISAYRRAADLVPGGAAPPRLHLKLGVALQAQGRLPEAIACFGVAADAAADGSTEVHSEAHFHTGLSLKRLGRGMEAATHFQRCLQVNPNHPEAQHLLHAVTQTDHEVSAGAATAYAASVFDRAAETYDEQLVVKLGYDGPALLHTAVSRVLATATAANNTAATALLPPLSIESPGVVSVLCPL